MADFKVTDVTDSVSRGSMTSPMTQMMMDAKAMFSVKHLLDMPDQKHVIGHLHQLQDQQIDDAGVSHPAESNSPLQRASVTHDDSLSLVGTPAGACPVSGEQLSLSTGTASPSRHTSYADMPDIVQASAVTTSRYDQHHPCTRWIQSNASLDCYTGRNL